MSDLIITILSLMALGLVWLVVTFRIKADAARIEALEAELAAAKTVNREVLYRENDELRARIEALQAALRLSSDKLE